MKRARITCDYCGDVAYKQSDADDWPFGWVNYELHDHRDEYQCDFDLCPKCAAQMPGPRKRTEDGKRAEPWPIEIGKDQGW